ncbi:MAG: glycolate oxidase subunit GlcE [Rhodocyclaceae bacterium]|nr:glycolate oxidase subunit GlcE [Rhodocyclaceae bacterium]
MSDLAQEFAARIRTAETPLVIRAGGSKDFYGNPSTGERLDVSGHVGVLAYEPSELVITARAGTKLAEIEAVLAEKGQCLPFEPPRFSPATTLGGMVAAGLSGPRRVSAGSVRDHVLGVKLLDGQGRELSFGGQVMKNVAGFDVSRLLAGSLGTLGVLLEVSLKVMPRPATEASLRFELGQADALKRLAEWQRQPLPIAASCWCDGVLSIRLAGAHKAVEAACRKMGGEAFWADDFWQDLRDQRLPFFGASTLWRLSLPAAAPVIDLAGQWLIEWGGALRWLITEAPAQAVRAQAAALGGHATLFRGPETLKRQVGVFSPLSEPLMRLHQRLKAAFDPKGLFNPGRLYPEL